MLPILLSFLEPSSIHQRLTHCSTFTQLLNPLVLSLDFRGYWRIRSYYYYKEGRSEKGRRKGGRKRVRKGVREEGRKGGREGGMESEKGREGGRETHPPPPHTHTFVT